MDKMLAQGDQHKVDIQFREIYERSPLDAWRQVGRYNDLSGYKTVDEVAQELTVDMPTDKEGAGEWMRDLIVQEQIDSDATRMEEYVRRNVDTALSCKKLFPITYGEESTPSKKPNASNVLLIPYSVV